MTTPTMDALDVIRKRVGEADVDFLRETLQVVLHAVMDADVSQQIGAGLHERTPDRGDYRNGYRARRWDTRAGTIDLRIPKLRQGSYLPAFLDPRRRSEQAPLAVAAVLANARSAQRDGAPAAIAQLRAAQRELLASEDFQAGVRSFREKSRARFRGR